MQHPINKGNAEFDIQKRQFTSNIGLMPLKCLIFQDDIAHMYQTMDQTREGAMAIGRMLDRKQLRANTDKSKYMVIWDHKARISCLEDAEERPIIMGTHKLGNSTAKKYLSDQISQQATTASIA